MFDSQVTVAIVTAVSTIVVAYITVRYKDRIIGKNITARPKDRMDTIFDGYESLIKQQQADIDRKVKQLDQTQHIIDRLQDELDQTKEIVRQQQAELEESKGTNAALIKQLGEMKKHYTGDKPSE